MSRIATLAATTAAVMMLAGGALAAGPQSSTPPPPTQQTPMADREEDFLKDLAQSAQVEIESSRLAATKAQNAEVKAFAEKLVTDHSAASEEMKALVHTKRADWQPDDAKFKEKKLKHQSLQTLSGAEFDKEYLEDMISDHEGTIAMLARYKARAKDTAIKSFAEKMEPSLRDHLKMARDLKAKLFK